MDWFCRSGLRKGLHKHTHMWYVDPFYNNNVWEELKCALLMTELGHHDMTLCILEDFKIQLQTTRTPGPQQSHSQTSFLYCWKHCSHGIKWVTASSTKSSDWSRFVPVTWFPQKIQWVTACSTSDWSRLYQAHCFPMEYNGLLLLPQVIEAGCTKHIAFPENTMGYCLFHKWLKLVCTKNSVSQGIQWVTACHHKWLKQVPMLNAHRM